MKALVEQLMDSPQLPEIVDDLQRRLREERERREQFYKELAEDQKAEFINGSVILHSPAKVQHLEVRKRLERLLDLYVAHHELGAVFGEKALCVFPRNDYEPDVCYFGPEKASQFKPHQLKLPVPDFVAEVLSGSTEKTDRGEKFEDYQAHGVGEYWIVDPDKETLEQYVLQADAYQLALKSGTGEVRSVVVNGFAIPIRALFEAQVNLRVLAEILSAPPA